MQISRKQLQILLRKRYENGVIHEHQHCKW